jgi:inosose dehydratase
MKLGYQTNTWGGVVGHPVGVTSIKDLFYLANGSTEQALRDVASAGYDGVEIFDGNVLQGHEDGSLRRVLDETGLALVGVYSGANFIFPDVLDEELHRIERAADLAAEYGADHFVVGGGAQTARGTTEQDYERLAAALDRVVALAEQRGLVPSYHPHLSTIVENGEQLEKVMSRSSINFVPDTAHLAAAGADNVELIRTYGDRIKYVHLKDFRPEPFGFLPLGEGVLDLASIVAALREVAFDGWITVELDEHADPLEGAKISRRFLEPLLAAELSPGPS